MTSCSRTVPADRAMEASIGSVKKTQACAPRPDCKISKAAGTTLARVTMQ